MNAITDAVTNSVSLELDSSHCSALDELQAMCGEFDTLCQLGLRMSRSDKTFLARLEDDLWFLTRRICVRQAIRWLQNDSLGEVILADLDPEALGFSELKLKKTIGVSSSLTSQETSSKSFGASVDG